MSTIAYSPVNIQTSAESVPSVPAWFGEITLLTHHLTRHQILEQISEQVRFARRRFGHDDVIDFVAVLFGYAVSGERTLEAFYQQLHPWASTFMAHFGRDRLPARSTLSRFLASLDQTAVEALRSLFLQDLLARPLVKHAPMARLVWKPGQRPISAGTASGKGGDRALPCRPRAAARADAAPFRWAIWHKGGAC